MQTRHRIPSIFNLSMVDVLCCALGCIILLWLVYFKEARERSIAAGQTNKELVATKVRLDSVLRDLTASQQNLLAGKQSSEYLATQLKEVTALRDLLQAKWEKTDKDYKAGQSSLKDALAAIVALRSDVKSLESVSVTTKAALAEKAKDHASAAAQVAELKLKLEESEKRAAALETASALEAADLKSKLADSEKRFAKLEGAAAAEAAELKLKLADSEKRFSRLEAAAAAEVAELKSKLSDTEKRLSKIESAAALQAGELYSKLTDSEKRASKLEVEAAMLKALSKEYGELVAKIEFKAKGLQADLDKSKLDIAGSEKRYADLVTLKMLLEQNLAAAKIDLAKGAKDLASAKELNAGLVGESKGLTVQLDKLKSAAENRFAGIELTGARVLFLVDMSGSMRMKDDNHEDPEKWPLLCEILGKLMQSLPDLKQFQIILFSDRVRYPLGNDGKWYDYAGPTSVKVAIEAVRAVTPQNATNMTAAFEEAFRFRAAGLDTIYLLSDGLPNMGDGLPANSARMSEAEKSTVLAKYVRDRLKTTWNVPYGRWAKQRVRINAVGFYFDSPEVGAFLWALARDNDGSFVGLSKP